MPDYYDADVQCPFWIRGSAAENKIFCEGPAAEARLQLWFKGSEKKRRAFIGKYCCRKYTECAVYKITEAKYDIAKG